MHSEYRLNVLSEALDQWGLPLWGEPLTESVRHKMGMILEAVDPNDAIVHYPVELAGKTHTKAGVPYHITLRWGKWDGSREELVQKVQDALHGLDLSRPRVTQWAPEIFRGRDGDKVFHVLVFQSTAAMKKVRDALSAVFGEDPFPDYKPHITVDEDLWQEISKKFLLPADVGLKILPMEVALGNQTLLVL